MVTVAQKTRNTVAWEAIQLVLNEGATADVLTIERHSDPAHWVACQLERKRADIVALILQSSPKVHKQCGVTKDNSQHCNLAVAIHEEWKAAANRGDLVFGSYPPNKRRQWHIAT